ncbi:MAG: hypothetical protein E7678_08125 [Ruminococcaceae bacterium]|nr:hypothetical protein [Oscillospiraceae bacterium]
MNYKDNIDYRENLEKKFFSSQKLTDAEKQWCIANPVFNGRFDFPCYKRDVISIPREQNIKIKVNVICCYNYHKQNLISKIKNRLQELY